MVTRHEAVKVGVQVTLAVVIVAATTVVGRMLDVHLTTAALLLLLAVLVATLLGRAAAVAGAADELVALFGLVRCTIRAPGATTTATAPGTPGATTVVQATPLEVEATARREHPLQPSDRALLEALVAGLATAVDRLRLAAE